MSRLFFYVTIFAVIYVLLFFPIYLAGIFYFDFLNEKFVFSLSFYKLFQIYGGYVTIHSQGIIIHRNKTRADLLPYKDLKKKSKKFSFVKTFEFISAKINVETSAEYVFGLECARRVYEFLKVSYKKLKNTNVDLRLIENQSFKVFGKTALFFNGFILLTDLIIYLWGKMQNLWQIKIKKLAN